MPESFLANQLARASLTAGPNLFRGTILHTNILRRSAPSRQPAASLAALISSVILQATSYLEPILA